MYLEIKFSLTAIRFEDHFGPNKDMAGSMTSLKFNFQRTSRQETLGKTRFFHFHRNEKKKFQIE